MVVRRLISLLALLTSFTLILTGCFNLNNSSTKKRIKEELNEVVKTVTQETAVMGTEFGLAFALQLAANPNVVQAQALPSAKTMMKASCATGSCSCQFYQVAGGLGDAIHTSAAEYHEKSNSLDCTVPTSQMNLVESVRIITNDEMYATKATNIYTDETGKSNSITLSKLMKGYDVSKVRKIYRYKCQHNYLQKDGYNSSTGTFVCSDATFYGITAQYNYFLYQDNSSDNFGSRQNEFMYANGNLCGLLVRQIDCRDDLNGSGANQRAMEYGLYRDSFGIFNISLVMTSAPTLMNGSSSRYGYAAPVDDTGNCAPGLEKRFLYKVDVQSPTAGNGFTYDSSKSNYDDGAVDAVIATESGSSSFVFQAKVYDGGSCNGSGCTAFPQIDDSNHLLTQKNQSFSKASIAFCVIPSKYL